MRIIAVSTLRDFWTQPGRGDAEQPLKAWVHVVRSADWSKPTDVKQMFRSADILRDSARRSSTSAGTNIGLSPRSTIEASASTSRFIGTHAEYDKVDAETV